MRAVLRSSPADLEALMEPEIAEALAISAEVVSSTGRTAIQAYAAELIESQRDWEPLLAKCETSITLFIGAQDPHTPQETVREYFAKYPQIRLIEFKDAGHLAFMTHWRELIAEIGSAAE